VELRQLVVLSLLQEDRAQLLKEVLPLLVVELVPLLEEPWLSMEALVLPLLVVLYPSLLELELLEEEVPPSLVDSLLTPFQEVL